MKPTLTILSSLAILLGLAACAGSTPGGEDDKNEGDQTSKGEEPAKTPEKEATPPAPETPPAKPADPVAIPTAKIKDGVTTFLATNDALFVTSALNVERTAPDGTAPATLASLRSATQLATDGTDRIFALLDKGSSITELVSVKGADGSDVRHISNWARTNGTPTTLAFNEGRLYFVATKVGRPAESMIISTSALAASNATFRVEELAEAKSISPAFTKDRLFAVDHYRQSAVRVSLVDLTVGVDIIQSQLPNVAGGIATDGTDVFTRTSDGIVKVAVGSGANSDPIVVVPSSTCPIFDPSNGAMSNLEDALVIDGANIYTACRSGASVEIRAYNTKDGALVKMVATQPFAGSLTHLRVTSTGAYWLSKSELWRAAK